MYARITGFYIFIIIKRIRFYIQLSELCSFGGSAFIKHERCNHLLLIHFFKIDKRNLYIIFKSIPEVFKCKVCSGNFYLKYIIIFESKVGIQIVPKSRISIIFKGKIISFSNNRSKIFTTLRFFKTRLSRLSGLRMLNTLFQRIFFRNRNGGWRRKKWYRTRSKDD